jgi:hypothetical protein
MAVKTVEMLRGKRLDDGQVSQFLKLLEGSVGNGQ